jgi:short-subunit dehydrogenase
VHAMSKTLRVELRPFGINVVLLMPGAVRSNFGSANMEELRSRNHDWKLYREFEEAIVEGARASQGGKATDATLFARHVVKKV